MATTKTKPLRILTEDHGPIHVLAELRRESPASVVHAAVTEYFANHRDELVALHDETRRFIVAGDVDGLAAAMRGDANGVAERLAARNSRSRRATAEPAGF